MVNIALRRAAVPSPRLSPGLGKVCGPVDAGGGTMREQEDGEAAAPSLEAPEAH